MQYNLCTRGIWKFYREHRNSGFPYWIINGRLGDIDQMLLNQFFIVGLEIHISHGGTERFHDVHFHGL